MKRVLAALAVVGMSVALFAGCRNMVNAQASTAAQPKAESAADSSVTSAPQEIDLHQSGITFRTPEEFSNLTGYLMPYDIGETNIKSGVYQSSVFYVARTEDEQKKFETDMADKSQEEASAIKDEFFNGHYAEAFTYTVIKEDMDINAVFEKNGINPEEINNVEIGHANGLKYYMATGAEDESLKKTFPEEMYAEYVSLVKFGQKLITDYTFMEPKADHQYTVEGTKISFETTDINGNTVKSEDLFKDHKVTMINIWATTCGACKGEFGELEELNKKLADQDCQIIGICMDTIAGDEKVEEAKAILEEYGVTYTNLVENEEMLDSLVPVAFPTTYFVGSDGTLLTVPVVGAEFDAYDARLQEAMEVAGK